VLVALMLAWLRSGYEDLQTRIDTLPVSIHAH